MMSKSIDDKYATIEILKDGEVIFGNTPSGRYMVREYEDDIEEGASFYETIIEAERHVIKYQGE